MREEPFDSWTNKRQANQHNGQSDESLSSHDITHTVNTHKGNLELWIQPTHNN